jgi:hypothetical protein
MSTPRQPVDVDSITSYLPRNVRSTVYLPKKCRFFFFISPGALLLLVLTRMEVPSIPHNQWRCVFFFYNLLQGIDSNGDSIPHIQRRWFCFCKFPQSIVSNRDSVHPTQPATLMHSISYPTPLSGPQENVHPKGPKATQSL